MSTPLDTARYALRQFRAAPMFTLAAVLTLALGIGGTTAIFTLIHAVMLKSLPVADPARLYRIGSGDDCCVLGGLQDEWGLLLTRSIRGCARPRRSSRMLPRFRRRARS